MPYIPQEFIEEVLQRSNIVEQIGQHVSLKKKGREYSGLCPFHKEKTPSFFVSEEQQVYYCHGCGAKGNLVGFMTNYEKYQYRDAIEYLAEKLGMEVPEQDGEAQQRTENSKNIYALLEATSHWYQQQLQEHNQSKAVLDYLQTRGVSEDIRKSFALGYAPNGSQLAQNVGQSDAQKIKWLELAGLIKTSEEDSANQWDMFQERLMFPIRDTRGRHVGFGGRRLNEQQKAKYLNSPETQVFSKKHQLYALYEVLQHKQTPPYLLMVEGYMDALMCHQYGFNCAVASLGTALGTEQLELAFRYTSKIIVCFDGDAAGVKAAARTLEPALNVMQDGREIAFLSVPEDNDPDSLLREHGTEFFQNMLDNAKPLSSALIDHLKQDIDLDHIDGRARLKALSCTYLNMLGHCAFREMLIAELAQHIQIDVGALKELLKSSEIAAAGEAQSSRSYTDSNTQGKKSGAKAAFIAPHQDGAVTSLPLQLLSLLLYYPELAAQNNQRLSECIQKWQSQDLATEPLLDLIQYMGENPQAQIHDVLNRYAQRYPDHPPAKQLVERVSISSNQISEQAKICEAQMEDLLQHMERFPSEMTRRHQLRSALMEAGKLS